ncbi:ABC transporter substrate-binding protein [Pseudoduganella umbonata]|uniref:Probable sugar-binding periplasmic protein n=1 Tax=Pseudoduganella umbonata TaxID=864828 RepID=A0A4P8HLR6_9BURK|nr:ABC transporter substrate-binding protein [Pseudoduganella umbonata]MBB3219223.1 glucose/mannose transport system substrate-binding protein [Pseudoduganella umbonata]QCP09344.1 carbohydrate ABC transporter substrate-binding protein [Pseudoduganella umbonata]
MTVHPGMLLAVALALAAGTADSGATALEVLNHLETGPDQRAAQVLQAGLRARGHEWIDFAVANGAEGMAATLLDSRIRLRNPPAVAQMKGPVIAAMARRGLLLPLDELARAERWDEALPRVVADAMKHQGRYVGVPLNIHRINWLWVNQRILKQAGARVPASWDEFFATAEAMKRAGHTALAYGGHAWEEQLLFESVALGVGGPAFYRQALVAHDPAHLTGITMARVLQTFRRIRAYTGAGQAVPEQGAAEALASGAAGMMLMGDWANPQLYPAARRPADTFACAPSPGSAGSFSYVVDSFAMFKGPGEQRRGQMDLAAVVMSPATQHGFNLRKGSIPARTGVALDGYGPCARQAAAAFQGAARDGTLVPALAMVLAPELEQAFREVLSEFWNDERIAPATTMRRLVAITRKAATPAAAPRPSGAP